MSRGTSAEKGPPQITEKNQGERPKPLFVENARMSAAMDTLNTHPDVMRILNQLWRKDPDTYSHCHRVADLAQAIARGLGISYQERVEIYLVGLLHDIGKIMTPDLVLKKPGPLSSDEFAVMRLHPIDSGNIVASIPDLAYLAPPIRAHHERLDGKGYPDQRAGENVPIYSRIVLVADTFDAMTNNRVYRKQLDLGRTYDELQRCSGTQFDPEAVKSFIALHQRFMEEKNKESSNDIKKAA